MLASRPCISTVRKSYEQAKLRTVATQSNEFIHVASPTLAVSLAP